MERETGIEPATNSLEGCDSTTELLPPSRSLARLPRSARYLALRRGKPAAFLTTTRYAQPTCGAQPSSRRFTTDTAARRVAPLAAAPPARAQPSRARKSRGKGWWGGEGSNLRSPKAAGLQPAAIDRSATSPKYISCCSSGHDCFGSQFLYPLRPWAAALRPAHVIGIRVRCIPEGRREIQSVELAEGFEPPTG